MSGASPGGTQKKGRPTPKRSEAAQRRVPVKAPQTRKEAYALARAQAKDRRSEVRRGMAAGDERAMLPRDRGPERALLRDLVDASPSLAGVVYAALLVPYLVVTSLPRKAQQQWGGSVQLVLSVAVLAGVVVVARVLVRRLQARMPGTPPRGLMGYAAQRLVTPRWFRRPKPRVKRGQQV